jgi:hypothetical protein
MNYFVYFRDNGENGCYLAASQDGFRYQDLAYTGPLFKPQVGREKLVRDPCPVEGPDGTFHMVWTCGWWEKSIGYATTKDFRTWTKQRTIPVMEHEPVTRNAWAPEIIWDEVNSEFRIFWSSTIPGTFPETQSAADGGLNHRIYCCTTRDFITFSPTRLMFDPGYNCIDATISPFRNGYLMVIKDETREPAAKYLRAYVAKALDGPWECLTKAPFTPSWVEGPAMVKTSRGTLCVYDKYTEGKYGAHVTRDGIRWKDCSSEISVPSGSRHGTIFTPTKKANAAINAAFTKSS